MSLDTVVRKITHQSNTYVATPGAHNNEYGCIIFGQRNKDPEQVRREILRAANSYLRNQGYELIGEREEKPRKNIGGLRVIRKLYKGDENRGVRDNCRITVSHQGEEKKQGYHRDARNPDIDYTQAASTFVTQTFLLYFAGPWIRHPKGNIIVRGRKGEENILVQDLVSERQRNSFLEYLHNERYGSRR